MTPPPSLADAIKDFIEKVNIKEIATRDFVTELDSLYKKVTDLEAQKERLQKDNKTLADMHTRVEGEIAAYQKEYVVPAQKLQELTKQLQDSNKNWLCEKTYIERENKILSALLTQITSQKLINASGGSNGYGGNYNENSSKAQLEPLPAEPFRLQIKNT